MKNNKLSSRQKGNIAENRAKEYLLDNGFEIIASNYYTPFGEIDIIATKDNIYHFIEVKSGDKIEPLLNITQKKLERIYKSIDIYLSKNNIDVIYSVDVIRICRDKIDFFSNVSYG